METINPADEPKDTREDYEKISQAKSGARWFFWIAALSLVNSLVIHFGGNFNFVVGLAFTKIADTFVFQMSGGTNGLSAVKIIALSVDVIIAGVFALLGLFASRLQMWAFIVGMVLYALDGGLAVLFGDFLSAAFHAFALVMIFLGVMAARKLNSGE